MSEWAQGKAFHSMKPTILKQTCWQALVRSQSAQHHCPSPGCFPQRDPRAGPRARSSIPWPLTSFLLVVQVSPEGSGSALLWHARVLHSFWPGDGPSWRHVLFVHHSSMDTGAVPTF